MAWTRRGFLRGTSAAGAAAAAASLSACWPVKAFCGQTPTVTPVPVPVPVVPTLRAASQTSGLLVGSAVDVQALRRSPEYASLIQNQCNIVVGENAMKFGPLRPAPDQYAFDEADYLVDFAKRNGIQVRGHNFTWHQQMPGWFGSYVTAQNAEQVLVEHIEKVAGRYAGRMHSWDVCNEAIEIGDGLPGGLRNSPWFKLLGPAYIDLAFRTARRVDPHAMLCYNDYDIESEASDQAAKRAAVLALVGGMQSRGVPIDAIGMQGHIAADPQHVYGKALTTFMAQVHAMGLKLLITEMDVNDRALPASDIVRDEAVARCYTSYLGTALASPDVVALLTWGLTDKYTWLNGKDSRADHLPERCLPFDADLKPVAAYSATLEVLRNAPKRRNA